MGLVFLQLLVQRPESNIEICKDCVWFGLICVWFTLAIGFVSIASNWKMGNFTHVSTPSLVFIILTIGCAPHDNFCTINKKKSPSIPPSLSYLSLHRLASAVVTRSSLPALEAECQPPSPSVDSANPSPRVKDCFERRKTHLRPLPTPIGLALGPIGGP